MGWQQRHGLRGEGGAGGRGLKALEGAQTLTAQCAYSGRPSSSLEVWYEEHRASLKNESSGLEISLDVLGWCDLPSRAQTPCCPHLRETLVTGRPSLHSCPKVRSAGGSGQAGPPSSHSRQLHLEAQGQRVSKEAPFPAAEVRGKVFCVLSFPRLGTRFQEVGVFLVQITRADARGGRAGADLICTATPEGSRVNPFLGEKAHAPQGQVLACDPTA